MLPPVSKDGHYWQIVPRKLPSCVTADWKCQTSGGLSASSRRRPACDKKRAAGVSSQVFRAVCGSVEFLSSSPSPAWSGRGRRHLLRAEHAGLPLANSTWSVRHDHPHVEGLSGRCCGHVWIRGREKGVGCPVWCGCLISLRGFVDYF